MSAPDGKEVVEDIGDFVKKWGTRGPGLLIYKFIEQSPDFPGAGELARVLGEMVYDLQTALDGVARNGWRKLP